MFHRSVILSTGVGAGGYSSSWGGHSPPGAGYSHPLGYMDLGYYRIWLTSGRYASYWNTFSLLHTNEVWGKVIFLLASDILSTRGGVSVQGVSRTEIPLDRDPPDGSPLNRDPQTETPGQRPPPVRWRAGGTHPTGMHSC